MEALIDKILVNIQKAYGTWSWWCLAIIAAVFAVMIVVNSLLKLLFKKATSTQMQGMRKALSSASVFAVAVGVIYLFAFFDKKFGLCENIDYSIGLVVSNCAPVAFCAMTLWGIVKAVGRVGVLPLIKAIWGKAQKPVQKWLSQVPLDKQLREQVFASLDKALTDSANSANVDIADYLDDNNVAVNRKVATALTGLLDSDTIAKCTELFIGAIKAKYPKKEEKKTK